MWCLGTSRVNNRIETQYTLTTAISLCTLSGSPPDLLTRTCASSCKDLIERVSPGSPQDFLTRTTVLCEPALSQSMHMDISDEAIDAKFSNENAADQDRDNRFVGACAVEMHMDISKEVVYAKKNQANCCRPKPGQPFCASVRSRNALGHLTRNILCENSQV